MARKKQYDEEAVIEKAMCLFWRHGYESTSMQLLEKEMGINKFSIYSSFGSKQGLFSACLDAYQSKTRTVFEKFQKATTGIESIRAFFIDTVDLCFEEGNEKGCLLTNTYYEFADKKDTAVQQDLLCFMQNLKEMFVEKLRISSEKDEETILKQANYLLLAKHGLAAATRVNSREEIEDYIEITFQNLLNK